MTYLVVLAAMALVPALAILLLRVNGAIAFMSLCLGSVLIAYTAADVDDLVTSFAAKNTLNVHEYVAIGMLVIPFLLALLFTRGHVKGFKKFTNILPALATGLLFALLLVPLLSASVQHQIQAQAAWRQLNNLQTSVILGGAAFSLLFLLFTHRTKGGDDDKKHGKD
jgi:hypothetical protein